MKKILETDVVRSLLHYLRLRENQGAGMWWRNQTGAFGGEYKGKKWFARTGTKGSADIVGLLQGGRFCAIEAKRPGGKQTPDQIAFQARVEKLGGLYCLAYGVTDLRDRGI